MTWRVVDLKTRQIVAELSDTMLTISGTVVTPPELQWFGGSGPDAEMEMTELVDTVSRRDLRYPEALNEWLLPQGMVLRRDS